MRHYQTSPISEMDTTDNMHEALFAKRGCCFLMPCCIASSQQPSDRDGGSIWWQQIRTDDEKWWWIRGWRKMREWSELVAGPRWKTFIRRFGRNYNNHHHCYGGGDDAIPNGKFRYNPLSYSLNFDDGKQTGYFDDEFPYRDYSMRFAAPPPSLPVSTKCSIDFDSDDGYAPPMIRNLGGIKIHAVFVTKETREVLKEYAGFPDTKIWLVPSFENSA